MTTTNESTNRPALYCGTYAKYNNGSIAGAWMYLDEYTDATSFFEACEKLHSDEDDPEFMFQDYEFLPKDLYAESMSITDLEACIEYAKLSEEDRDIVEAFYDATGAGANYFCGPV